jgi:hypothetical protein
VEKIKKKKNSAYRRLSSVHFNIQPLLFSLHLLLFIVGKTHNQFMIFSFNLFLLYCKYNKKKALNKQTHKNDNVVWVKLKI